MNLHWIDQVVLCSYLIGIVIFGCYFSRHNTSTRKFMDAGGRLAGWVVGLSIFGTYLSSISFLGNPGASFDRNWNPFVFSLSLPLAAWIACQWFVPFYRKNNQVSAYSHLGIRFGKWAKNYAILCFLLTQTVRIGAVLLLVAMAVHPLTGIGIPLIILVLGIAVILYTFFGGIEAVIWTDVVQSIVLTIGILVAIVFIAIGMPNGPKQIFEIALQDPENLKFSLGSFSNTLSEPTFWVILVFGLFINLQNFGIDQTYVQRYATAVDEKAAKKSVWLACWLYLPVSALLFFVGTCLYAYYQARPDLVPADFQGDQAFAHYISTQLPVGLVGLLIAAILAAAMSSVDSSLNSCATLICIDIWPQFQSGEILGPDQIEQRDKRVLILSTVGIGLLGIGVGVFLNGTQSVLDAWWKLAGILSGGMLGLFILGLIARDVRGRHALAGVCVGVMFIIWMTLSPIFFADSWFAFPWHANLIIVLGTVAIIVLGVGISFLFSQANRIDIQPDDR
jgi:SSS family solute:Na+ symporter